MGQKVHADTSWLIALFNPDDTHHSRALRELDELTAPLTISALVLAELLVSFEESDSGITVENLREAIPSVMEIDSAVAIKAAAIRSLHKSSLGDAIVIASAALQKAELLSFDRKMIGIYERIK